MPELRDDPLAFPRTIVSGKPMSDNHTGNWRSLRPQIDEKHCTGCLICWKFCPEGCVHLTDKVPQIDFDYCKGCGICVEECPRDCMSLEPEKAL